MPDNPATADQRDKPRCRWFQFRLRTLLIGVAIAALLCPIGARYIRKWLKPHVKKEEGINIIHVEVDDPQDGYVPNASH